MNWARAPREHEIDNVAHLMERADGETFWDWVDSTPGHTPFLFCRCREDGRERCPIWDHQRDGEWCLAASSERKRCSSHVIPGTPFCDFHMERAWVFLVGVAGEVATKYHGRMLAGARATYAAKEEEMFRRLELEKALKWDAAEAARRTNERVYFYVAGHAVKVGRSIHPERRVRTLTGTKAPEGIDVAAGELVGTIPGGCHVEGELHRRFGAHRLVGEWFEHEPIRDDIAALIADAA